MRIYISGKITGTKDYMKRFAAVERELEQWGHTVVNPARINAQMPSDTSWEQYMVVSYALLSTCACIYMMAGWEDSKGARLELEYARSHGIAVMWNEETGGQTLCNSTER